MEYEDLGDSDQIVDRKTPCHTSDQGLDLPFGLKILHGSRKGNGSPLHGNVDAHPPVTDDPRNGSLQLYVLRIGKIAVVHDDPPFKRPYLKGTPNEQGLPYSKAGEIA
jgi:hypothetical protein